MFMDVRMCECIVCMKGVASSHQTFLILRWARVGQSEWVGLAIASWIWLHPELRDKTTKVKVSRSYAFSKKLFFSFIVKSMHVKTFLLPIRVKLRQLNFMSTFDEMVSKDFFT